jgi:hypothetical protein
MSCGDTAAGALLLALPDLAYIAIKSYFVHCFGISGGGFSFVNVKRSAGGLLVMRYFYKM